MIETIQPKDEKHWLELRKQDVTSSDIAALFGCSKYCTEFELWHRKHDNLEIQYEEPEWQKWGKRLEASIAAGAAEDNGWTIRPMKEYMRDPELRMGSSFDYAIGDDGILECKNVFGMIFKNEWVVDGEHVEMPLHIECQIQHQLAVSGRKYLYVAALISGNKIVLIKREPDIDVITAIKKKIKAFWESVASHDEPKPEFQRDSDFISRLYSFAEPGKVFNADERVSKLAYQYKQVSAEVSVVEEKKDAIKAEILTLIGDAEKVIGASFSISAGLIGPKWIERYERAGYRSFRINWKKEKQ